MVNPLPKPNKASSIIILGAALILATIYFLFFLQRPMVPAQPAPAPLIFQTPAISANNTAYVSQASYLGPFKFEYQKFNQCASVSIEMALSYWLGLEKNQMEIGAAIKPHPETKHTTPDKIAAYFKEYGLQSRPIYSADYGLIKKFIDNGIPVIFNHRLKLTGHFIGHWSLIRGYDEKNKLFITADSYFGPDYRLGYKDLADLWRPFAYFYLVAYPSGKEKTVETILAPLASEEKMVDELEKYVWAEIKESPADPDNYLNLGRAAYLRKNYEEAVRNFEKAQKLGLETERILWYLEWPVISYNEIKRTDKVLELTEAVFKSGNPAAGELIYERGRAYLTLGEKEQARREFKKALEYEPDFEPAREALEQLGS